MLSRHELTKGSVTSAQGSYMLNDETSERCECVNDLTLQSPVVSTQYLQQHPAAAAAERDLTANVDVSNTLSQLEDELESLLSM